MFVAGPNKHNHSRLITAARKFLTRSAFLLEFAESWPYSTMGRPFPLVLPFETQDGDFLLGQLELLGTDPPG